MSTSANDYVYKGYRIEIHYDSSPENPRRDILTDSNLGTMVCFHGRYDLGDNHNCSIEEARRFIAKPPKDVVVILPLYLYDHSGITIATTPFSCPWDSGQVGFIYASRSRVQEIYGNPKGSNKPFRLTKELRKRVEDALLEEVKTYDQYLSGNVFGYEISDTSPDTPDVALDSCWGFFGEDSCRRAAEEAVDGMLAVKEAQPAPHCRRYNHAYSVAFSLESLHPDGDDVTAEMLQTALQKRIRDLDRCGDIEWLEACGAPYDTYEIDAEIESE